MKKILKVSCLCFLLLCLVAPSFAFAEEAGNEFINEEELMAMTNEMVLTNQETGETITATPYSVSEPKKVDTPTSYGILGATEESDTYEVTSKYNILATRSSEEYHFAGTEGMDSQRVSTIDVKVRYTRKKDGDETVYRIDYVEARYSILAQGSSFYFVDAQVGYRVTGSDINGAWRDEGEAGRFQNAPQSGHGIIEQTKNIWIRASDFAVMKGMFYGILTGPGGSWSVTISADVPVTIM